LSTSRKKQKDLGLCALCGEAPATTEDHLPPQAIYPKELREGIQLHWVPTCAECNNGSSNDDEWFKAAMCFVGGATPEHEDAFVNSLASTVGHNNKIAKQIFSTAANVSVSYGDGVAKPMVGVKFDEDRYNRIIEKIVRGLYWRQKQHALGKSSKVTVVPGDGLSREDARRWDQLMNCLPAHALNNNLFFYKCNISHDGTSTWGMQFFNKHWVFACVKPSDIVS
jgi:hypothetical protein